MQNSDKASLAPKPARGRPRAFDRDAALSAATRLFWQKGYAATSISDLTEAMGIGSPSLYAAFGSKEALYGEALRYYGENYEAMVWGGFNAALTGRAAVEALLMDSAAALTGSSGRTEPLGCMVTLSAVGSEGHAELGEIVKSARGVGLARLKERLSRAVREGELTDAADIDGLARFAMAVQNGMSVMARDGASRDELQAVARHTMAGWDDRTKA
ncbi:MAG: TetR/AcrR family transcriptional regulator [Pseudorhodoplanes sp.]